MFSVLPIPAPDAAVLALAVQAGCRLGLRLNRSLSARIGGVVPQIDEGARVFGQMVEFPSVPSYSELLP